MANVIVWADIPVLDLDRAMKFYGHVTGKQVVLMPGGADVAVIGGTGEGDEMSVSADLYVGTPSAEGATVYFSTDGDIDGMISRVVEAGGTIQRDKAFMGPMVGWVAFFLDTEGNRVGLQQPGDGTEG